MLRKLEQEIVVNNNNNKISQQMLLEWDQTLSPQQYVKTLLRICRGHHHQQPPDQKYHKQSPEKHQETRTLL
jgi:hypothetical protein